MMRISCFTSFTTAAATLPHSPPAAALRHSPPAAVCDIYLYWQFLKFVKAVTVFHISIRSVFVLYVV